MKNNIPRILIGGSGSGCGKTTVTCALLQALKNRRVDVTAFKCGPDYIDPMFHSEVLNTRSRNLDLFMCGENTVKYLLANDSCGTDMAVIEGVMGIYDGLGFKDDSCSANDVSRVTNTPEVLLLNVKGKSVSLAAEAKGYLDFADNNIKGLILNDCSQGMYPIYKGLLEEKLGIRCYGYLPKVAEAELGSRHLGLITAAEINDLRDKMNTLGKVAEGCLDIDGLIELATSCEPFDYDDIEIRSEADNKVRIAIARDRAFCFYYEDSLELLAELGAELVPFSPINDKELPEDIQGLILGGGYPELYLDKLTANKDMLASIRNAINNELPVYAECGGFMYLGHSITYNDRKYDTVGAIPGNFKMTDHLVRFGYKVIEAKHDNLMCKAGETIKGHEFHYSESDDYGADFKESSISGKCWDAIQASENIFAGYPHIHLWSNMDFAANFVEKCRKYSK